MVPEGPRVERMLTLLRHGQSTWNAANRFTGWTDVDLSDAGVAEAHRAARLLQDHGLAFDIAFSSVLRRAIRTLWLIQDDLDRMWVPVHLSWRLNERHYGALQGLDKAETAARFGSDQVHRWRRSYRTRPPALELDDPRYPGGDPRYATLQPEDVPRSESLEDTVLRVAPYWKDSIAPRLDAGERVLIVAHGNSLRGLVKYLDGWGDEEDRRARDPDRGSSGVSARRTSPTHRTRVPWRHDHGRWGDRGHGRVR